MNIAGSLNYDTKVDTSGINKGLDDVKDKSTGIGSSMKVAIGNIISDLATLTAQGVKQIVSTGVQYNAEIEKYQTALTTLTGSADEANKIIEQIKKDAATTPFDVNGLVQANQLLISTGLSGDEAREDILALGNAISATGGGNEELSRMAVNLQQIKNVGKASSLDIKQFAYAGIDVYGLLADSMGVTREEASELDVTYEDLTKALKKASSEGGKYYGAMENQSKTFNGQVSNLKDNLNSFIGEATEPLFNLLKEDILPVLNDIISGTGNIDELIPKLISKITEFIMNSLNKLIEMLPQILNIGIQIISNLVSGIGKALPTLIPVMYQAIINMVNSLIDNIDLIIDAGLDLILGLADGLVKSIPFVLDAIPKIITSLVTKLLSPEMLSKILEAALELILTLGKGLVDYVPRAVNMIPNIIKSLKQGFIDKIKDIDWKQVGKNILDGILNGLTKFGDNVKEAAKKLYNEIKNKIKDFFGISSPAKSMMPLGGFITQGVAVGIKAETDSIDDAIDDINSEIMDKMTQAVQLETGSMNFAGTNGSITQMLSAFGTTTVVNENKLYLDGDQIYENQQEVSAKKNLQTQFGGGYSVSS